MNKSKNKGKQFERTVCKIFESVYNEQFIRVPNSGAFIGGSNINNIKITENGQNLSYFRGDIIPPKKYEKLIIECKKRAKIDLYSIITGNITEIKEWLKQLYNDYRPDEQFIRLLIISANSKKPLVVFNSKYHLEYTFQNYLIIQIDNIIENLSKDFIITELSDVFLIKNEINFKI